MWVKKEEQTILWGHNIIMNLCNGVHFPKYTKLWLPFAISFPKNASQSPPRTLHLTAVEFSMQAHTWPDCLIAKWSNPPHLRTWAF